MASIRAAWKWFDGRLKSHPYTTNMISSCTIAGFGDTCAQTVFRRFTHTPDTVPRKKDMDERAQSSRWVFEYERTGAHDLRRTVLFMSYFLTVGAPLWLTLYRGIEHAIPKKSLTTAFQKGVLTWLAGFITSPVMITYLKTMDTVVVQGKSPSEAGAVIKKELKKKMIDDLPLLQGYGLAYWSIHWIPLFYLLPAHVRLLYSSFVQIGWSTISSMVLHRNVHKKHTAAAIGDMPPPIPVAPNA